MQAFGKAYAYRDGLAVTVGAPQACKPTEYAAGKGQFTKCLVFDVTVVNKSAKP
ncbi:hypothetical protein HJ590_15725 [Naumannella sp. ID2617S]|nr:hypothetical protein [Naumannella sp. ID2617S]